MAIFFISVLKGIVVTIQFFFNFVLIGILYHTLARRYFSRRLIEESKKMGLEYLPSEYYHEFGTLYGKRNGYMVSVKVDSSGTVTTGVYLTVRSDTRFKITHLELTHQRPLMRPAKGEHDFTTSNNLFNHIFKTRRADKVTVTRFCASNELIDSFVQFYLRWMFRLHYMSIDIYKNAFECKLNYGNPWTAYIPPNALKKLIADLILLMGRFGEVFKV